MKYLADSPVTTKRIQTWIRRDPTLASVLHYIWHGVQNKLTHPFQAFPEAVSSLSMKAAYCGATEL